MRTPPQALAAGRRIRACGIVAAAALLLASLTACTGEDGPALPDPVGATVGSILEGVTQDLNETIATLGDSATEVARQLGGQIQLTIDQATSAFATLLNDSLNQVDAETKQTLNEIQLLVDDLSAQSQQVLTQASDQAQLLMSQIPFTNKNPRVTGYTPRFTTPATSDAGLLLRLDGAFSGAAEPGYTPVLKVNGTEVTNALKSNVLTRLEFLLPGKLFTQPDHTSPDITVELPYEKGSIFHKKIVPGIFHFSIATLPNTPVRNVILSTTVPVKVQHTQEVTTQQFGYSSLDCKPHSDSLDFSPQAGWYIDTTSVRINVLEGYPRGPSGTVTGPQLSAVGPTGFTVKISTAPACFWPIVEGGRTHFTVSYRMVQTVDGDPKTETCSLDQPRAGCPNLALQWDGSNDVAVPQNPGRWSLALVLFNGTNIAVGPGAGAPANPWVSIHDLGTHVQFSATALDKLPYNAMASSGTTTP